MSSSSKPRTLAQVRKDPVAERQRAIRDLREISLQVRAAAKQARLLSKVARTEQGKENGEYAAETLEEEVLPGLEESIGYLEDMNGSGGWSRDVIAERLGIDIEVEAF